MLPLCGNIDAGGVQAGCYDASGKLLTEGDGADANEQMERLDQPVGAAGQQTLLRESECGHDEAPDSDERDETGIDTREGGNECQGPEREDDQQANRHMERNQKQGVIGPEEQAKNDHDCSGDADEHSGNSRYDVHGFTFHYLYGPSHNLCRALAYYVR